ncbi:MAG: acyl-CoA dehydrogenase family protein [Alphaproteobacteria bacterium]|nr:acyl-CoA dehydrogenase family protein [Alphaproteobacteria bacterium]
MSSFYDDNDDLRFYVDRGIDWGPLVENTALGAASDDAGFDSTADAVDFYREVLQLVGGFAAEAIAPHAAELDRNPPRLVDGEVVLGERQQAIFDQIAEMGLHGLCVPGDFGGMNCPLTVYMLTAELMARADVSIMTHHSFHGGIALAMLMYSALEGSTEIERDPLRIKATRFAPEIERIVAGEAWGSMDITEPGAGSDMGALRARAVQDEAGDWFVTGEKVFITSGHGRYHFVIARTEDAAAGGLGLEALSLFLVEAWTEGPDGARVRHATVERIEEKLGHHASPTVSVRYDRSPARLVGERGEGFKLMLLLMNNARVAVGFESLGIMEAAWRMARAYAAQRESMGKTIDQHEIIADWLDEMQIDIQGLRALAVQATVNEELHQRKRLRLQYLQDVDAAEVERLRWTSRLITPLVKYVGAERAVETCRRALQIHGGYGYTAEYGAEKLLRDALVLPIYEGTSQIQALMATKDSLLWILRNPQGFVKATADARWRARFGADPLERRVAALRGQALAAQRALITRIVRARLGQRDGTPLRETLSDWDPKRDFGPALLHAEHLTRLLADAAIADALLDQAHAHADRAEVLARHLERAEPRARHHLDLIKHSGDRLLASLRGRADTRAAAK